MSIKAPSCPICRKPGAAEYMPFCSRGCRDRDFLSWANEGYRVPVRPEEEEDEKSSEFGVDSDI